MNQKPYDDISEKIAWFRSLRPYLLDAPNDEAQAMLVGVVDALIARVAELEKVGEAEVERLRQHECLWDKHQAIRLMLQKETWDAQRLALDLEIERDALKAEVARLRKQNHDSAAREHARADAAEKKSRDLLARIEDAKVFLRTQHPQGAKASPFIEDCIAGFLHEIFNLETANSGLKALAESWAEQRDRAALARVAELEAKSSADFEAQYFREGEKAKA
jgi:hypothetical protein